MAESFGVDPERYDRTRRPLPRRHGRPRAGRQPRLGPIRRRLRHRDGYRALYERAADGIRAAGGFAEPELWRYDWERAYTRDELLDLIPTSGGLTSLPPREVERVMAEVGTAVDALGGGGAVRYATWGVTAARTGQPR